LAHVRELEQKLDSAEKQVSALLEDRFDSVDELDQLAEKRARLVREREDAQTELQGVLGDRRETLAASLRDLLLDRTAAQEALREPALSEAELGPEETARLQGELQRRTTRRDELRHLVTQSQTIIDQAACDREDLLALQEERREVEERLEHLRFRVSVLETTALVMREAREETLASAGELLEGTIAQYLDKLTLGRYASVAVDRENLEPCAYSEEKGGPADTETELSLATKEQLYLAARLALVKLLWPDSPPPLLLDDPLVNFDAVRHQRALELLAHFGERGQVLLFTCASPGPPVAGHVVEL
jgi:uncharacterized protein YhaN